MSISTDFDLNNRFGAGVFDPRPQLHVVQEPKNITLDSLIAQLTQLRQQHGNMEVVTGEGTEEPSDEEYGQQYFCLWHHPIVLTAKKDAEHGGDYEHAK